uniref:YjeJ family protein n=1 Tax=Klebsiella sp. TaxID=576 RepID=UPI002589ABD8|nr:YjeJ family protein [Klebsiella sp.]
MVSKMKGMNTAPIKVDNRFALMTFKFKTNDEQTEIIYMKPDTLVDFLVLLRSRMLNVIQRLGERGEIYKAQLQAVSESLLLHVPEVILTEVQQPDIGRIVTSLAPKIKDEQFTLITILQNEHIISLKIDDSQVEFIILAIQQALTVVEDKEMQQFINSLLDFLLIYSVDLSNMDNLQYRHIDHEKWKQKLFSNYLEVLYCFDTEQGKRILAGTIIKVNSLPDTKETENIITRLTTVVPALKAVMEQYTLCQTFCRILLAQQEQELTLDECLRPLYTFCLETQATLNS